MTGLVLFIMTDDHTVRLEVGYGLEGIVPDALASRVVRDILIPSSRAAKTTWRPGSDIQPSRDNLRENKDREIPSGQQGSRKTRVFHS